jgi:hypothetical protein
VSGRGSPTERHLAALRRLAHATEGTDVAWTLSGSFGLYVQGMPRQPNDLDVEADEAGAAFFARHFAAEVVRPLRYGTEGNLRSHFAVLALEGTTVDIVGDLEVRVDGEWIRSGHHAQRTWIDHHGLRLPVLDAELELAWTARIGRTERAALIAAWLASGPPRS